MKKLIKLRAQYTNTKDNTNAPDSPFTLDAVDEPITPYTPDAPDVIHLMYLIHTRFIQSIQ